MAVSMTMGRDTKWLTLEVCREFQRGTCSRSDAECKFAHPSRSCHVENGRVIACFDSLKVTIQHTFYNPSFPSCISCALTHVDTSSLRNLHKVKLILCLVQDVYAETPSKGFSFPYLL